MKTSATRDPLVNPRTTEASASFSDRRPLALAQRALNDSANSGARNQRQRVLQQHADSSPRLRMQGALRLADTVQRVPVGTGAGTDNDRNNIQVADIAGTERISATRRGANNNAAQVTGNFSVNAHNFANRILKHYMVVRSGTRYQFPIKHLYAPGGSGPYTPNAGALDGRGSQPEGFGGNADLAPGQAINNELLTDRRLPTLRAEYLEENHAHGGAVLNLARSKKFGSVFGVGTLSITTTDAALAPGHVANGSAPTANRGEAEMAGTVVIDCDDLIGGILVGDDLEQAIGDKLQNVRNAFYATNRLIAPIGVRLTQSVFAVQGGILAHLVAMVKDDIVATRADRQQVAILAEQERQENARLAEEARLAELARELQEARLTEEVRRGKMNELAEQAEKARQDRQKKNNQQWAALIVALGLVILLVSILTAQSK